MKFTKSKIFSKIQPFLREKSLEEAGALELHQSYLSAEKEYRLEANKLRKIVSFVQSEIKDAKMRKEEKLKQRDELLDRLEDLLVWRAFGADARELHAWYVSNKYGLDYFKDHESKSSS